MCCVGYVPSLLTAELSHNLFRYCILSKANDRLMPAFTLLFISILSTVALLLLFGYCILSIAYHGFMHTFLLLYKHSVNLGFIVINSSGHSISREFSCIFSSIFKKCDIHVLK